MKMKGGVIVEYIISQHLKKQRAEGNKNYINPTNNNIDAIVL